MTPMQLNRLVTRYEQPAFIQDDPISIPHGFDDPQDQEVIGLYAALLAWGRRTTTLSKMADLCARMQYRPYPFVLHFDAARDAHRLSGFKHRTFQPIDALWFTKALSALLQRRGTLEPLFTDHLPPDAPDVGPAIEGFSQSVLHVLPDTPHRLRKHLARPSTGSACKRLNMYLRWMVRPGPVDLGIWHRITPGQLVLPLDVHSGTQARKLGYLSRRQNDWKAALELTKRCKTLNPMDPARYDFAFFGVGVNG